jgi:hypothetical protein
MLGLSPDNRVADIYDLRPCLLTGSLEDPVEDENTVLQPVRRRTRGCVALAQWIYITCRFQYLEEKFPGGAGILD